MAHGHKFEDKMKRNFNGIRKICMVSAAAFSAASGIYEWTAPIGTALGLVVDLTEDEKKDNQIEFESAVETALERTSLVIHSESKKRILDELVQMELEIDSLNEIIKKTEAYRKYYCTASDAKEIIEIFEMFLRDEISKRHTLSNLYILSTGLMSLENLKKINDILYANEEKIDSVSNKVSKIEKIISDAQNVCTRCFSSLAFILIGMAVFLGVGIFVYPNCDRDLVFCVPICYGITEFLMWSLSMNQSIVKSIDEVMMKRPYLHVDIRIKFVIFTFVMPILMTLSCFWMILKVTDIGSGVSVLGPTLGVVLGNFVSIGLKTLVNKIEYSDYKL